MSDRRRRRHVVTWKRLYPILHVVIFIVVNCLNQFSLAEEVGAQRQLGCVWRPKNASLFCLVFENGNNKSHFQTDVIRQQRDSTKYVDLECFRQEKDLKKISTKDQKKSDKNSFADDNDYLDDDDGIPQSSRELWTQLQFVRVRGCPLHQVAVINNNNDIENNNNNNNNNVQQFTKPLLGGANSKSDDFFSEFLQPTIGGRVDWTRIRGLELTSSGLNRPLSTRTRTFCELSEVLTTIDLSSNFYSSIFDIFGSALKVSDKCPFAKLSTLNVGDNQIATLGLTDLLFAPNLETLDLSSNKLDLIETGALRHLTQLKTLHLSDNQLSSLSPPPWSNLTSLRELYLQGNKIERLPDFVGLSHLVALNLSRNSIPTIDDNSFVHLGELVALDLSHNRIVQVSDDAFVGLKSLQVLTLAHNRIQSVSPDSLSHLATLHALVLSHNVIEHVHQVRLG